MHIHLTNLPYLLCPLNCCCKACACCIEIHKRLHQFDTGRATYDATSKIPCGSGFFVPKMAMCQSSPILVIFPDFDTFCRSAMNNEIPKWWFKQQGKAEFGSVFLPKVGSPGVGDVRLCLHIGVGCGEVTILQVRISRADHKPINRPAIWWCENPESHLAFRWSQDGFFDAKSCTEDLPSGKLT